MTEFEKRLRISKETRDNIKAKEKEFNKSARQQTFKDKIGLAICEAIEKVEVKTRDEEIMKTEYMMNINKILSNYEELRPLFMSYFENKKRGER